MTQQFPYQTWVLSPSHVPKEVTVVRHDSSWNSNVVWRVLETGSFKSPAEVYPTKSAAIAAGLAKLEAAEAKLVKQAAKLRDRRENLEKQK